MATLANKIDSLPAKQKEDAEELLYNLANGHTEVAKALNVSESSVRRFRKNRNTYSDVTAVRPTSEDIEIALDHQPEPEVVIDLLRRSNVSLQKRLVKAKVTRDELISTVYGAALTAATRQPVVVTERPSQDPRKAITGETALWHMTDWQLGKSSISYNSEIARERVYKCIYKYYQLTEIMRSDHPVKDCTILFTGDMVENCNIFPKQVWEIDSTLYDQLFNVSDLMTWVVRQALSIYETVQVVCEWGNHGRIGTKTDMYKASDNVDRMAYEITKRAVGDAPGLTNFQVSDQWFQHFTIGNYSAVAIHGDEISSFGGILRKANQWSTGVLPKFDDLYIGHFHQRMTLTLANGGSVYMTGSTESDNLYAQEVVAAQGVPSQRLHFVNPDSGRVTFESSIWLD